ncbi:Outer dense fiber protein 3-like protein 2 [Tritrichomonas musculus]|uniref:Outer dense fiber protein 3-like protein 2 n=1 Tax=Tritrichomonas musculus TaxID=1915356 RepID=A0ABR2GUR9_9EUKA
MASEFFAPLPPTAPPEPIPFLVTSSGANASPGPASTSTRGDPLTDVPKTYLKGRHPDRNDVNTAPYRDVGSTIGKGKKFTLKGRCEEPMPETGPSPDYVPPPFGSGARAATVHQRAKESTKESTPGPGQYQDRYSIGSNARKSTFHGPRDRGFPVREGAPGPGSYAAQMPPNKTNNARIVIGHRLTEGHTESTPGPGQYKVPTLAPNKSKGNIGVRLTSNSVRDGPGPAEYETQTNTLSNIPRIYLHGRVENHQEVNQAPYRVIRRSSETPRYSMRSRYYQSSETTPGVDYVPPAFGKDSRKVGIGRRLPTHENETTPGPGAYKPVSPKDLGSARKSTFHGPRTRSAAPQTASPGPAEYGPDYNAIKSRSPRFTMKGAKYEEKRDKTGEYVDLGSTNRGPRYSLGARPALACAYS